MADLDAPTLLDRLRAAGLRVVVSEDLRLGVAPRSKIPPELGEAIRAHRDALVALLVAECPWPAGFACPSCGTRERHGHA
jgi:hypothetical protein